MKKFLRLGFLVVATAVFALSCINKERYSSKKNDLELIFNLSDSLTRAYDGEIFSREQLELFLGDSTTNLLQGDILVNDEKTLIEITEPILFQVYGKGQILNERPYEIYLFGDYWIMNGTMPRDMKGGTFTIAINRRTCKVIGITHGK
jgi:hypothetical protein